MAMHPNSLANLKRGKQFGKGQATNNGGAPKGKRLSTYLKEIADEHITANDLMGNEVEIPAAKAAALALFARAINGQDVRACEVIFKYLNDDGKDKLEISGNHEELSPAAKFILQRSGILPPDETVQ